MWQKFFGIFLLLFCWPVLVFGMDLNQETQISKLNYRGLMPLMIELQTQILDLKTDLSNSLIDCAVLQTKLKNVRTKLNLVSDLLTDSQTDLLAQTQEQKEALILLDKLQISYKTSLDAMDNKIKSLEFERNFAAIAGASGIILTVILCVIFL